VECKDKVEKVFSRDVLWSPKIIAGIHADAATSKSHLISLFDLEDGIFQSETPPTGSVTREMQETININEATCTYIK
jgi:hypothetical protein